MARKSIDKNVVVGIVVLIGLLLITLVIGDIIGTGQQMEYFDGADVTEEPKENVEQDAKDGVPINFSSQYDPEVLKNDVNRLIFNALQTIQPARRGAAGPQGAQGVQGPAGGPNIATGVFLRNVHTKAVSEKLSGVGGRAKVMLAEPTHTREQAWVLQANNQLKNLAGNSPTCMTADDESKEVYMTNCSSGGFVPRTQQWRIDGAGRIRWLQPHAGKQWCLETKPHVAQGARKVSDNSKGPPPPIEGNFLFVSPCANNNPQQIFSFS